VNQLSPAPDYSKPGKDRSTVNLSKHDLMTALQSAVSAQTVLRQDELLAKRTTLRVGGGADFYVEPASENELTNLLQLCKRHEVPFVVLGRGSNLLVRDGGIRGLVICLAHAEFSLITTMAHRLHCGAGAKLKLVAAQAKRGQLTGLEFLEGIPGTVGGGLCMNAGAMGGWMFDVVESIRYMDHDGVAHEEVASKVTVEYRSCPLLRENIALGAVLKGHPASKEVVESRMKTFSQKRWESQPAAPSAGCIFKNPATIPAGKLIDELGLKGTRFGDAMVSHEHGNFIVNQGNATAKEVLELIEIIREKARAERGIDLQTEVEIIGQD
jgi:UDP-N-acetylenolpyruvoylglucosamine reductase